MTPPIVPDGEIPFGQKAPEATASPQEQPLEGGTDTVEEKHRIMMLEYYDLLAMGKDMPPFLRDLVPFGKFNNRMGIDFSAVSKRRLLHVAGISYPVLAELCASTDIVDMFPEEINLNAQRDLLPRIVQSVGLFNPNNIAALGSHYEVHFYLSYHFLGYAMREQQAFWNFCSYINTQGSDPSLARFKIERTSGNPYYSLKRENAIDFFGIGLLSSYARTGKTQLRAMLEELQTLERNVNQKVEVIKKSNGNNDTDVSVLREEMYRLLETNGAL